MSSQPARDKKESLGLFRSSCFSCLAIETAETKETRETVLTVR
jgi:hypothetical protein